jgi:hypothetical protein
MTNKEWVHTGFAGHFCGAKDCNFRLAHEVGDYLISTVGAYFPGGGTELEDIGFERKFETYVFNLSSDVCDCPLGCGCRKVSSFGEIEAQSYNTAIDARAGHFAMCHKYDEMQGAK